MEGIVNMKVWNVYEKVTYVLSTDIKCNEKYLTRHGISPEVREHMIHVGKNQSVQDEYGEKPYSNRGVKVHPQMDPVLLHAMIMIDKR